MCVCVEAGSTLFSQMVSNCYQEVSPQVVQQERSHSCSSMSSYRPHVFAAALPLIHIPLLYTDEITTWVIPRGIQKTHNFGCTSPLYGLRLAFLGSVPIFFARGDKRGREGRWSHTILKFPRILSYSLYIYIYLHMVLSPAHYMVAQVDR